MESRAAHTNPKDTQVPPPPRGGVAVAYRRWAFTISSNFKALTGKILVFWIAGRLWEVVAYEKWSHMEVAHYVTCLIVWNFKLETLYSFVSYLIKAYKHCL